VLLLRLPAFASIALTIACVVSPADQAFGDTASDLLEQGIELHEQGQSAEAREMLLRIDPIQLSSDERVQLTETLQALNDVSDDEAPEASAEEIAVAEETEEPTEVAAADEEVPEVEEEVSEAEVETSDLLEEARLLYAQQKAAEATEAMDAGQFSLAARLWEQALELDPDNDQYKANLAQASAAKERVIEPVGLLQTTATSRDLAKQEATARYDNAVSEANASLEEGDYAGALDAAARASRILDDNERALGSDYRPMRQEATELREQIVRAQQIAEAERLEQVEITRAADEAQKTAVAEAQQAEEINGMLTRASALREEMKYEEALRIVEQVLFIDPNNLAAQFLRQYIQEASLVVEEREIMRQQRLGYARMSLDNQRALVASEKLVEYPAIWPRLTERRLAGLTDDSGDSEINRQVLARLRERIPVEFDSTRLANVVDFVRLTTGVDIFVNWPALEAVGIEQDTPISLTLRAAPADQVLNLVLRQANAAVGGIEPITYTVIDGLVTVSTAEELKTNTIIRQYDIRDLLVQVPNFSDAPEFDLDEALSDNTGDGGGGSSGSLFGDSDSDDSSDTALSRPELIQEILTLVQDTVGNQDEWINFESTIRELNGNLIVKTTPENHRAIFSLLQELRETRAIQISVETRFLLVDENFLENVGIDLDVEIDSDGDLQGIGGGPIEINQNTFGLGSAEPTALSPTRFFDLDAAQLAATSLGFGVSAFLDDVQVDLLVSATQANRRAISLTAPRVTFFNGQRAYVLISRQEAFISDLEPVSDAVGFDITLSVVQEGVVLDVEGTVSSDRRYVTLTLRPSLSEIINIETIEVQGSAEIGDGDDTTTVFFSGIVEAPEIQVTDIRTTVSVPDRGTLLTGGQRLVEEIEIEAGVPVLSKIPFISRFFTNNSTVKDEQTLLILVKPTIIIQSELEEDNFPGLITDPAQYNDNRYVTF